MATKPTEEQPILTIQPSIVNALFLDFLKNFFKSLIFGSIVFFLFYVLNYLKIYVFSIVSLSLILFFSIILFSILPLSWRIVILYNTNYLFFKDRVVHEFKFFNLKKESLTYDKITEINSDITLWDRLCNAGDIVLHAEGDDTPDIKLLFVKDPKKIESMIYDLINKNKVKK